MKTRILFLLLAVALASGLCLTITSAQSKRDRATKEFMRDKLELSQKVLEGLATEDYDLLVAKGLKLSSMTKQASWRMFENPDYEQQSVIFRRHVDALVTAGRDKNLDAATLAYVRMTMSCIDCHKLVRGKLVASLR
jgi:cytochrome c556